MTDAGQYPHFVRAEHGLATWKRGEAHILVYDKKYWDSHYAQIRPNIDSGKAFSAPPNKNGLKDKIPVSDELDSTGSPKTDKSVEGWMADDLDSYYMGDTIARKDDL